MLRFNFPVILILFSSINIHFSLEKNETEIFVPTNEWKIVKPNQQIPAGLHIRSNLQTGITEAKLMENDNNTSNSDLILVNETESNMTLTENDNNTSNSDLILVNETESNMTLTNSINYSPEELKKMLKNIKNEDVQNKTMEINGTKFRSYDQLKEELESMKMNFKTDLEIIRELMTEIKNDIDIHRKMAILQDLEYYLHQIDNGQNFVDMGGLSILHKYIDEDEFELKSEAFRCLTSALQGNNKVKIVALENGTLTRLLVQLKSTDNVAIANRILVAISAITRQFPIAQVAFTKGGGVAVIGSVFDHYSALSDMKMPLKIVTLFSDWLRERIAVDNNADMDERQKQYKMVDMRSILLNEGWCMRLERLLSMRPDLSLDYYEKVINSIINFYPICHSSANRSVFLSFLKQADLQISQLASEPDSSDDFYFNDMRQLVDRATAIITAPGEHSEL